MPVTWDRYRKRFMLWMPMKQDLMSFNEEDSAQEDEEEFHFLLPVEEMLDRAFLKSIRIEAVERAIVFLCFLLLYCAILVLQRNLADAVRCAQAGRGRRADLRGGRGLLELAGRIWAARKRQRKEIDEEMQGEGILREHLSTWPHVLCPGAPLPFPSTRWSLHSTID